MLEVIDKGTVTDSHPAPLLFVHGAWHAAWCWDEHFLDFFANEGFRAAAVSLRGHGASTSSKPFSSATFADHVDDVQSAVDTLGAEPVLVGHSLGGLVVQKYLENHDAPAAVLMAPHPPQLNRRAIVALLAVRKHPWLTVRANTFASLVGCRRATASRIPWYLFSAPE